MDNDTTKTVKAAESAQFTAKTNGIILNGEIHLLALSQSDNPCEDCSIRKWCSQMASLPCVMLSGNDNYRFQKV